MLEIGVLGSTRGSDLPTIIESINNGELKGLANIATIISDKKDSGILEKAKNYKMENYYLDPKGMEIIDYDKKISEKLDKYNVQLIVLIGYMRLFSKWFVQRYQNRIMNIHPSLLPAFPGIDKNVHKNVLNYGCKVSGCTLFFVDEGKDTGPIIKQKAVSIDEDDNIDILKAKVQKLEQEIYPEAIKLYALGKLKIKGRKVVIGS
ncbi:MAG TPA: phosphoribosylglycinamide formyltransferase [Candidatus Paceibacterota bacterium]|nr:phosphoribosylglycinamide formyltransferase [Candidatus Paceibacterota bacterium]